MGAVSQLSANNKSYRPFDFLQITGRFEIGILCSSKELRGHATSRRPNVMRAYAARRVSIGRLVLRSPHGPLVDVPCGPPWWISLVDVPGGSPSRISLAERNGEAIGGTRGRHAISDLSTIGTRIWHYVIWLLNLLLAGHADECTAIGWPRSADSQILCFAVRRNPEKFR